jgi:glycosyltransferase involved in cell wall biosynthesis
MKISVIIPSYNERRNVGPLYDRLKKVLNNYKDYEIIFIDDGSVDETFDILKKIHSIDKKVKVIRFRRNFGKACALHAGFKSCKGDIVFTLDSDLQDDPFEIPRFIDKINQGYDLVVGWKYSRKDPITRKFASKIFNFLVRKLTQIRIHDSDCNFRAMRKEVVKDIEFYGGLYRYIPSLVYWRGYRVGEIKVRHHKRRFGKSKFSGIGRLFTGFLDLLTIKFLISYKSKPSNLFGLFGIFLTFFGFITGLYLLYIKYIGGQLISNRPLLILTVLLIVLGIQFISFGLLGEMMINLNKRILDQYNIREILK